LHDHSRTGVAQEGRHDRAFESNIAGFGKVVSSKFGIFDDGILSGKAELSPNRQPEKSLPLNIGRKPSRDSSTEMRRRFSPLS
jgi:hypothetical protein